MLASPSTLRLALTALAATLVISPSACAAQRAPEPATPREFFGVNAQFLNYLPADRWRPHLDLMADSGIRVVRVDAAWPSAEPDPPRDGAHRYRWSHFDAIATELARRRLRWLPILDFSPPWAASRRDALGMPIKFSPPNDPLDFAAYARAFTERYGRGGAFWRERPELPEVPVTGYEIWNEQNLAFFWRPQPEPARYASLYLDARRAIRAADPDARVMIGGLGGGPVAPAFLSAMYAAVSSLRGQVDAVGLHPYGANPDQVLGRVAALRDVLDRLGEVNVPIEVTEVGWQTQGGPGDPPVSDETRAAYLVTTATQLAASDCGVERFVPHTWTTVERDPANREDWYGIVHPDGRPTASLEAYADLARKSGRGRGSTRRVALCRRDPLASVQQVRVRRARGRRATRACFRAAVSIQGWPAQGARVRFRFVPASGRGARPQPATALTGALGVARACLSGPRRARGLRGTVVAKATRPDLASVAIARAGARLR